MTARSRASLATQISNLLANNAGGDISAADVRSVVQDIVDSLNAGNINVNASAFTGNLSASDTTLEALAATLDALTVTADTDAPIATHDAAAPSHGAIRAKAQTNEDGLEGHIAQHPGAVVAGPPPDNSVGRTKLTVTLLADVDSHADQADLVAHETSAHNTDTAARTAAATAQSELDAHEATPHGEGGGDGQTAQQVAAAITTHSELPNIHHTPPTPGGGDGGVHTEQRVLQQDPVGSVDTTRKVIAGLGGDAYITKPRSSHQVDASGDFSNYTHNHWLGVRGERPEAP